MSKFLVTGGAGYIGSHTCKLLAQVGHQPVVYDNLVYGHKWAVKWGPLEEGDLNDTNRLIDVIKKHNIEAVIHFAAFCYVGESVQKPDIYYKNNVCGTLSLLLAMKETNVKKIVFSSTCATFGVPVMIPINEKHPQKPINPYGRTKQIIETILRDFVDSFGFSVVVLRYFNAAGADPDTEIGEVHDPETHLIPVAFKVATGDFDKLVVFGDDYDTPDGTCVRDYIHVTDLATAHKLALDSIISPEQVSGFEDYNLGNGKGFTVKQVISCAETVSQKKIAVETGGRRLGDPSTLISDSRKAISKLGWTPKFSNLNTIIETAWKWHLKAKTM